jgi:hypothetical protein
LIFLKGSEGELSLLRLLEPSSSEKDINKEKREEGHSKIMLTTFRLNLLTNGIGKPKMPFKPSEKTKIPSSSSFFFFFFFFFAIILVKREKFWECQKSVAFAYIWKANLHWGQEQEKCNNVS